MASHGFSAPSGSSGASLYSGLSLQLGAAGKNANAISEEAAYGTPSASPEAGTDGKRQSDKPKAWSAALGFAPLVRKRPAPTPSALSTTYSTIVSAPALVPTALDITSKASVGDHDGAANPEPQPSQTASKPPALLLPEALPGEDVNGFRQTAAGKRASTGEKKGKRKRKRRNDDDPTKDYSTEYEPSRPNDYADWKSHLKLKRAEEREIKRREKLAERKALDASGSEDDDFSSGEEDHGSTMKSRLADAASSGATSYQPHAGQFFAPPTAFYAARSELSTDQIANVHPASPPYQDRAPDATQDTLRSHSPVAQSGEEAYNGRLGRPVETGDDAYARRAAMTTVHSTQGIRAELLATPTVELSPSYTPADDAHVKARAIAERLGRIASQAVEQHPDSLHERLEDQQQSKKQEPMADQVSRPDPHAFAARLMTKYGWKQGQGLGASESGMVNPLIISQGISKSNDKNKGMANIGLSASRGNIVSDTREDKERLEKEKYGEPSRIILLRNVVGRNEVDEDLASEIGEEASKHGYVERCKVHTMPFNFPDDQAVRIFVVFSGLVGAWKALKELDGRHFGGRIIRATFFDEEFFARQAYGIGE